MNAPHYDRRLVLVSLLTLAGVAALVAFLPLGRSGNAGSPPPAMSPTAIIEAGREQFTRVRHTEVAADPKLTAHRMFNARSCAECHRQGGTGGGGPNENNVQLFDTRFAATDPQLTDIFGKNQGPAVLHRKSLLPEYAGFRRWILRRFAPGNLEVAVPQQLVLTSGSSFPRSPDGFIVAGNGILLLNTAIDERNTPPLFGLGLLESIPQGEIDAGALVQPEKIRGRSPRLKDGGRGRFGWKSSTATLLAFNENACAVELGLTTSNFTPATLRSADLLPHPRTAPEGMLGTHGLLRFVFPFAAITGSNGRTTPASSPALTLRAAAPPAPLDMSIDDVAALTRFIASLPAPRQAFYPAEREQVAQGERHFHAIGCATCHTPNLGGVTGVYSDLLLHTVGTSGGGFYGGSSPTTPSADPNFDIVRDDEFRTPPLWGVADSGPYLHDGSAKTLNFAIARHGLQAADAVTNYQAKLNDDQRQSLITFLESLRAPQ